MCVCVCVCVCTCVRACKIHECGCTHTIVHIEEDLRCQPHFQPRLSPASLWLFTAAYTRLANPHVSGNSPTSTSHLPVGTLGLCVHTTKPGFLRGLCRFEHKSSCCTAGTVLLRHPPQLQRNYPLMNVTLNLSVQLGQPHSRKDHLDSGQWVVWKCWRKKARTPRVSA